MGRKRLLALLTAVTATLALQAGPAAAQLSLPGLGEITLGGDDGCLEVGVDVSLADVLKLDPSVCVLDEDGSLLDVDGGVSIGDQELDLGETTAPVTDALRAPSGGGDADDDGSSSTGGQRTTTSRPAPSPAPAAPREDVVVAGDAQAFGQDRAEQAALLAQLRDDLAAQRGSEVMFGPVAPGVGAPGMAAAPEVAGDLAPGVVPADGAAAADPREPQRENALLASEPLPPLREVPPALQLLTGAMILGAGAVWYLARREFGGPAPTAI